MKQSKAERQVRQLFKYLTRPTPIERKYDKQARDTLLDIHRRVGARGRVQRLIATDAFIDWLFAGGARLWRYDRDDPKLITEFVRYFKPKLKRRGGPAK